MTTRKLAVVVLAAGLGTRMRSSMPKVLHAVAGKAMVNHVLDAVAELSPDRVAVVIGPGMTQVEAAAAPHTTVVQEERLGTGHAVMAARPALGDLADDPDADVLVVCGDTPLITPAALHSLREARDERHGLAVLGFQAAEPGSYGRLIRDDGGDVARIVEAKDATTEELAVDICNAGMLCVGAPLLFRLLERVGNDNAKGEYYLTDVVGLARTGGEHCALRLAAESEVQGINTRAELAQAEAAMQTRLRTRHMRNGVTLVAPETVFFCHDTAIAPDVIVHPHVVFGPGVSVGEGAEIKSFSHLEGATLSAGAVVGPYARLRPGAMVGEGARVGNFVEIKNASLGRGAKANHLSYLGDTEVGEEANIGAGTITCNYDGFGKHRTTIGAGAFIGSNTALVAPVRIGAGAIVGAGSTVTQDVPDDAIAVARGQQSNRDGAAKRFREMRNAEKAARKTTSAKG
ncbi:bifunctional UDP-N-acetylglucosamine diphosphorylase/glucosamine-1-phosphate N-acetyltransferase GlmU [Ferruginivarius sediminum]|uniref:Bifunctional protein GlmU n=1 Tax=Ferruginivarius sediminum TaxID=2661937 RepID=A0A369TFA6_9PROT|nr:bifunctional UDP-N-acetylglucosamine diphosphorylase/glucosamine-1-phosphate N-acetyltransferase GlmU [Ferruginivarius sediminum]RDD61586.1 bifunctional UDP-N-acetylglucosamine diphosphorylase/glucosamine-1-phosphate N-acetyltransferase GlmU [Ferruginivarius sediminum]